MSRISRLIIPGLLAVALAITYLVGYNHGKSKVLVKTQTVVIEKAQEGAKSAAGAREKRESIATHRAEEKSRQEAKINEALKDSPDWAAAPVPDGLWDSLGGK